MSKTTLRCIGGDVVTDPGLLQLFEELDGSVSLPFGYTNGITTHEEPYKYLISKELMEKIIEITEKAKESSSTEEEIKFGLMISDDNPCDFRVTKEDIILAWQTATHLGLNVATMTFAKAASLMMTKENQMFLHLLSDIPIYMN